MYNDKLCLLELVELLMHGVNYFYPHHPQFKYERIGVKNVQDEEYPLFEYDNAPVPFEELTWHNTRANLSILTKIPGKIKVVIDVNETKVINTFIYRNFTLIKDGKLHINLLPCHLDATIYNLLVNHYPNVIVDTNDTVSVLDFSKLALVNERVCFNTVSAMNLSHRILEKLRYTCHLKRLGSVIVRQIHGLEEFGIKKDGSYGPPTVKPKVVKNHYMAKEFNIEIINKKRITEQFMAEEPDNNYEETKKALQIVNFEIQKYKFNAILCGKWFDDLDKDNVIAFNDVVGTVLIKTRLVFSIDNVKVECD